MSENTQRVFEVLNQEVGEDDCNAEGGTGVRRQSGASFEQTLRHGMDVWGAG